MGPLRRPFSIPIQKPMLQTFPCSKNQRFQKKPTCLSVSNGFFSTDPCALPSPAFAIAITPAFSVVGWDERYMPNPRVCWVHINKADGCQHEIYASFVEKKINLNRECCEAIQGLSHKCKIWIFTHGRFTPEFGNQVKDFCATLGITLPHSYHVYYPMDNPSSQIGD